MVQALFLVITVAAVFFQDDFSDGNADGWYEVGPSTFEVQDGWYHFWGGGAVNDATSYRGDLGTEMSSSDYRMTADMRIDVGTFAGAMVRYREEGDYNLLLVLGLPQQRLSLYRWFGNSIELLDSQQMTVEENVSYTMAFQCSGEWFIGKAWRTGTGEPDEWMVWADDTLNAPGAAALFSAGVFKSGAKVFMSCFFDNVAVDDPVPWELEAASWAGIKASF